MKFTYRSKGTADDWTIESIEAENKKEVMENLDEIYGIERDKDGRQINTNMIQVELLS